MRVELFIKKFADAFWESVDYNNTVKGINQTVTFSVTSLIAGNKDDIGDWYFYFNITEDEGWSNITAGNSYVQTVTWDETDCPLPSPF